MQWRCFAGVGLCLFWWEAFYFVVHGVINVAGRFDLSCISLFKLPPKLAESASRQDPINAW